MVTPRVSENSGRVPCLPYGIFMFICMAHLFFLLKISCAFLEVGAGGSEAEKLFQRPAYRSAQWTGVLTYGRFEPWLPIPISECPHQHVPAQALPVLMEGKQGSLAHSSWKRPPDGLASVHPVGGIELSSWSIESPNICFYGSM